MHAIIGIAVPATDLDDAVGRAENFFNTNLLDQYGVDYGRVLGVNEIEDVPEPCNVLSPEGKAFADWCMSETKFMFYDNLRRVRAGLKILSDDDLWANIKRDEFMTRYNMLMVGSYGGHTVRLYDDEGVIDARYYDSVLKQWNEDDAPETWIVPMDIHF